METLTVFNHVILLHYHINAHDAVNQIEKLFIKFTILISNI